MAQASGARAFLGSAQLVNPLWQVESGRQQASRSLEILVGRYPAAEVDGAEGLVATPPPIPVGVPADILEWFGGQCPRSAGWRHREGNADAHVKAVLVGPSVTIPISAGRPALGTWQGLFLLEHRARPHRRALLVHVSGA